LNINTIHTFIEQSQSIIQFQSAKLANYLGFPIAFSEFPYIYIVLLSSPRKKDDEQQAKQVLKGCEATSEAAAAKSCKY